MAQAAHCSPRTISSAFRNRLGLSPLSHVRTLRLDRIRADILASTDPIGTIAYRWGVSHLGRFASAYRERLSRALRRTPLRHRSSKVTQLPVERGKPVGDARHG
ncbi:helix-turn-helix transcriptional regulator [Streptomyces bugieae]|uniref:Helix-turn-helix transcriptional regulator n=1 Tax=Streptomyces bugieae TaxID=3098223 RepID=A0ABU7NIM8_9ACTN|nr:helix-turn-helix transcriptional regulator [Streptomyces sp. DSM 41528]